MQIVYLTLNDRRAFLVALKPGMSVTSIQDAPGTIYIPGVDIEFRVTQEVPIGSNPTQEIDV